MTEISVGLLGDRKVALKAVGHAGFSIHGTDIVCAGVSALIQALIYGFQEVLKADGFRYFIDEEEAVMSLDWRALASEGADAIAETIVGSLKEISRAYPGYVRFLEVQADELEF